MIEAVNCVYFPFLDINFYVIICKKFLNEISKYRKITNLQFLIY